MSHIPAQWTTEGFMKRFDELLPQCRTYLQAYQETEYEHTRLFGRERYKSYDAFRQVRKSMLFKK